MQTQHDDHDDVVGRGDIDIVHDQALAISEARLSVDVGLTRRLGASLLLPFRVVVDLDPLPRPGRRRGRARPARASTTATRRSRGLADPMLLGAYAHVAGRWRFVGARRAHAPARPDRGQPVRARATIGSAAPARPARDGHGQPGRRRRGDPGVGRVAGRWLRASPSRCSTRTARATRPATATPPASPSGAPSVHAGACAAAPSSRRSRPSGGTAGSRPMTATAAGSMPCSPPAPRGR